MRKLFSFISVLAMFTFGSCATEDAVSEVNTASYFGRFQSVSPKGEIHSQDDVEFIVMNEGKGKSTIKMINVGFVAMMPKMTIDIPGVNYINNDGDTEFNGGNIVPLIGGKPFNTYQINNLTAEACLDGKFNVAFECLSKMESRPGTYAITYVGTQK